MSHSSDSNTEVYNLSQACAYLSSGIEHWIRQTVDKKGYAGFVLTGGKSITGFFDSFKRMKLPWEHVSVCLSDDRLVPEGHPASNEAQLKTLFLDHPGIQDRAHYISIKNANQPSQDILESAVAVFSMGGDGHVASLFGSDDLQEDSCLTYVSRPDYERVSLSYAALQSIGKKYILVYGDEKIDFFRKINMDEFYLKDLFSSSEIVLVRG